MKLKHIIQNNLNKIIFDAINVGDTVECIRGYGPERLLEGKRYTIDGKYEANNHLNIKENGLAYFASRFRKIEE